MAARRLSVRDRVRNLTQPGRFSNRALAAAVGVSEKTIRRWKSGARVPDMRRYAPDVFDTLKIVDTEVRSVLKREARRDGYTLPDMPVIFEQQRDTWLDVHGKPTVPASTITYDLEEAEEDVSEDTDERRDLLNILKAYRNRAALRGGLHGVRFLITTNRYTKIGPTTYWWPSRREAQPSITRYSDDDLKDLIAEVLLDVGRDGMIHKIRVGDAFIKLQ
jgi:transcriptional regulator with XRE-family HTH domain